MLTEEQKKKIEGQNKKISDNLRGVKRKVVVFSGKGGVGKTTVSVNLAYSLHLKGYKVGLLDADITGPNVVKMIGLAGVPASNGNKIIPQEKDGLKIVSFASFIPLDQAVIWRGPLRSKAIEQFLGDVEWGELDFLIADLPPGTGDEVLTIAQRMLPEMAIIVTTSQEISLIDSRRAINMAKTMEIHNVGIIENMSGFKCPKCGYEIDLFGSGGGEAQARQNGVTFLGRIPINIDARKGADIGKPIVLQDKDADISISISKIAEKIKSVYTNIT